MECKFGHEHVIRFGHEHSREQEGKNAESDRWKVEENAKIQLKNQVPEACEKPEEYLNSYFHLTHTQRDCHAKAQLQTLQEFQMQCAQCVVW